MNDRNVMADVGEMLVSLRASRGYDVELAATLAHLEPERLAEAEAGEIALDERELASLADAYGVRGLSARSPIPSSRRARSLSH